MLSVISTAHFFALGQKISLSFLGQKISSSFFGPENSVILFWARNFRYPFLSQKMSLSFLGQKVPLSFFGPDNFVILSEPENSIILSGLGQSGLQIYNYMDFWTLQSELSLHLRGGIGEDIFFIGEFFFLHNSIMTVVSVLLVVDSAYNTYTYRLFYFSGRIK